MVLRTRCTSWFKNGVYLSKIVYSALIETNASTLPGLRHFPDKLEAVTHRTEF